MATPDVVSKPVGSEAGVTLDKAPPMPPASKRKSLMDLGGTQQPDGGLGPAASSPQIMALQGISMIEMGARLIASALPAIAGPVTAFVEQLKQVAPQALASATTGGILPPGAPTGAPPPAAPPPAGPPMVGGGM